MALREIAHSWYVNCYIDKWCVLCYLSSIMSNDYAVGYGRPPIHSRFKPGRSGNPGGRRRGRTIAGVLRNALDQKTVNPATGRRSRGTWREALVAQLLDRCAENDMRAIKLLLDLLVKLEPGPAPWEIAQESEEDPREALIRELDRLAAKYEKTETDE
jgi:hypothetical protein